MTPTDTDRSHQAALGAQVLGILVLSGALMMVRLWIGLAALGLGFVLVGISMELG